jgi:hypothetical protein
LFANFGYSLLEKIASNVKLESLVFILNTKIFHLITKIDMSVEDGSAVVLE